MVRLHPRRLVGDQRVGRGVRFVEAVIGELRHQLEHLDGLGLRDAARRGAVHEGLPLRVHLGADLLAHRAAQQVGAAQAVAAHGLGDLHHLFLVDHDAVGLGQDRLQLRMRGLPRLAVLAAAVIGDVGHRARAEQGHGGDQVLEPVGPHLAQHVPHARGLELEHAAGIAARQHLVGRRVVQRQAVEIRRVGQEADRALQDGQRGQAQEVELHQPGLLDVFHRVLGDQRVRSSDRGTAAPAPPAAGRRSPRRRRGCWRGDTAPPAAAPPPSAGAPPRRPSRICCSLGSPSIACFSVTGLAGLLGISSATRFTWQNGRPSTRPTSRTAARACSLPKVMICATRSRAIFAADVLDHLVAPVLAEIDVEVRHRHALGVQEPLEQQAEAQRVQVGDGQRPGRHRPGARAAARPHRDALRLRPLDEVGDDQEVAGEAHRGDHAQLVFQPLGIRARAASSAPTASMRRASPSRAMARTVSSSVRPGGPSGRPAAAACASPPSPRSAGRWPACCRTPPAGRRTAPAWRRPA